MKSKIRATMIGSSRKSARTNPPSCLSTEKEELFISPSDPDANSGERYNKIRTWLALLRTVTGMFKEVIGMWLRISPEMDFYLDMELQGVNEETREYDVQQFEQVVY